MKVSSVYMSLAAFMVATSVHAAPEIEVGGEYNINITNTNDGLNDPNDVKQTSFNLKTAKVALRGKLSDQITWNVLYKAKESELERFWLTNKVADNLDVSIGKQKIKVYGLHRKITSSISPITGAYLANNPLTDKNSIDITYKLAGTITLQAIEDYVKCSDTTTYTVAGTTAKPSTVTTCSSWNEGTTTTQKQKQPALAFEYYGSFGEFSPLVQYALYDLGKSSTASVGLRYKNEFLDTYVDYTLDTRNAKGLNASGVVEEQETKYTGIVAYAEYKAGTYTPYLHVSTLTTDPYLKDDTASTKTVAESNSAGKLDRNEVTYAVGSFYEGYGNFYRPFAHVAISNGDFVDPSDATKTKKKDLSKTDLVVGLQGKF